jgi:hypothetical protein
MALAQRCGLEDLAGKHVTIASPAGVNPGLKIPCLVAGMERPLDAVARRLLARLASAAPGDKLPGAGGDLQRHLPRPQQRPGSTRWKAIS